MPKVAKPDYIVREDFSKSLIDGKKTEHRVTTAELAEKLDISDRMFNIKRSNTDAFTVGELRKMAKTLKWSDADVISFIRGKHTDCYTLGDIKDMLAALSYPAAVIAGIGRRTQ